MKTVTEAPVSVGFLFCNDTDLWLPFTREAVKPQRAIVTLLQIQGIYWIMLRNLLHCSKFPVIKHLCVKTSWWTHPAAHPHLVMQAFYKKKKCGLKLTNWVNCHLELASKVSNCPGAADFTVSNLTFCRNDIDEDHLILLKEEGSNWILRGDCFSVFSRSRIFFHSDLN